MFHPSTTQWCALPVPESLQDFEENPAAKLQALVRILKHHDTSAAKPLVNKPDYVLKSLADLPPFPEANTLVEEEEFEYGQHEGDGPDKVIVFSYFPSNEHILKVVSLVYTFPSLQQLTPCTSSSTPTTSAHSS